MESADPSGAVTMLTTAIPYGFYTAENGNAMFDGQQGHAAWFDVFCSTSPRANPIGQFHVVTGLDGYVEIAATTSSRLTVYGGETTTRMVVRSATTSVATSVVLVDSDGLLVSEAFEVVGPLSPGRLGSGQYAGLSDCVTNCLANAGIQIGVDFAICLVGNTISFFFGGGTTVEDVIGCFGDALLAIPGALLQATSCIKNACI